MIKYYGFVYIRETYSSAELHIFVIVKYYIWDCRFSARMMPQALRAQVVVAKMNLININLSMLGIFSYIFDVRSFLP